MLFNSIEFIVFFLPVTFAVYFTLTHYNKIELSKIWLTATSLFFYGWWNPKYLLLIFISMLINYQLAKIISTRKSQFVRKSILVTGLLFNIGLLGYYKYADFFITNFNVVFDSNYNLLHIVLPLGISFFTFQQIAFVVDAYRNEVKEFNIVHYALFVCFFPQLIAGPIVHHKEVMPQFFDPSRYRINSDNIAKGLFIFNMGLAKKIIIADTFGEIANLGYQNVLVLDTFEGWITAFSYAVQLYFDFSGYSDMAVGVALFFNIELPVNFNSPYKSENIQQFWRRWHITLSSFLRDYIYIPLGGNKKGELITNINLFLTFLIGGFWHGANWTFVVWGALNGIALVIHRLFQKTGLQLPRMIGIVLTFLFALFVWVFFRSDSFNTANHMLLTMFGQNSSDKSFSLVSSLYNLPIWIAGVILLFTPNSMELSQRFTYNMRFAIMLTMMVVINFTFMNSTIKQDFLYFDF